MVILSKAKDPDRLRRINFAKYLCALCVFEALTQSQQRVSVSSVLSFGPTEDTEKIKGCHRFGNLRERFSSPFPQSEIPVYPEPPRVTRGRSLLEGERARNDVKRTAEILRFAQDDRRLGLLRGLPE